MVKNPHTRNIGELFLDLVSGIYKYPTTNILVNGEIVKVLP